jgi:CBS domain-containing protein
LKRIRERSGGVTVFVLDAKSERKPHPTSGRVSARADNSAVPFRAWEAIMKVKDAMHRGATKVTRGEMLKDVARKMRDEDIGAIPVIENDQVVGMVTDRDIACRALADGRDIDEMCAGDIMSQPVIYCTTEEELDDAVHLMEQHQIRRLPVLGENNEVVGMLALGDVAARAGRELSGEVLCAVAQHHG